MGHLRECLHPGAGAGEVKKTSFSGSFNPLLCTSPGTLECLVIFLKSQLISDKKNLKREDKVLREKTNIHVLPPGPLIMVISLVKSNSTSHKTICGGSLPSLGCALLHLPNSSLVERHQSPDSFLGKIPDCKRILSTEHRHLRGQKMPRGTRAGSQSQQCQLPVRSAGHQGLCQPQNPCLAQNSWLLEG